MKVRMLRNPAKGLGCELSEGQTGDVDKDFADKLIKLRIAELVEDAKPRSVQGVPAKPSVAKADESDVTKGQRKSS